MGLRALPDMIVGEKHVSLLLIAAFMAVCMVCVPVKASAQETYDTLTEDNIKLFIDRTTEMTNGANTYLSTGEVLNYLDRHLHQHARFKSSITYIMPGFPAQETALSLGKDEFMENVESGKESVSEYENNINIQDIKISSDQKKATVYTTGYERGVVPIDLGSGPEDVPMEGQSTCTQILMLDKQGVIQMYNATCKTTINFQQY